MVVSTQEDEGYLRRTLSARNQRGYPELLVKDEEDKVRGNVETLWYNVGFMRREVRLEPRTNRVRKRPRTRTHQELNTHHRSRRRSSREPRLHNARNPRTGPRNSACARRASPLTLAKSSVESDGLSLLWSSSIWCATAEYQEIAGPRRSHDHCRWQKSARSGITSPRRRRRPSCSCPWTQKTYPPFCASHTGSTDATF